MELTPINLLLVVLFAPCIFIAVFMLLVAPLLRKIFDRGRPIEKQTKEESKRFRKEIKEKKRNLFQNSYPFRPSQEDIDQFRNETHLLFKEHRSFLHNQLKETLKVSNEETGLADVIKTLKVSDGKASTLWYLVSLLLMPVLLLLVNVANVIFGVSWQEPYVLIILLMAPIFGIFFSYRGYKIYRKKPAIVICIISNCIYFFPIYFVAISTLATN